MIIVVIVVGTVSNGKLNNDSAKKIDTALSMKSRRSSI